MGRATKVFLFHPSMYPGGRQTPIHLHPFLCQQSVSPNDKHFSRSTCRCFLPHPLCSNFHPSVSFIKVILSVVHEDADMYPCANWCRVTFDPLRTGSDCDTPIICRKNVKKLLDFVFTFPCVYPEQGNLGIKQTQGRELVYNVMSGNVVLKVKCQRSLQTWEAVAVCVSVRQ